MPQIISPSETRLTWSGAASVEHQADWSMPWRIDHTQRTLFAQTLVERAAMPAGVRIAFRTDSTWVAGNCSTFPDSIAIDLCCDGEFVESVPLSGANAFRFEGLKAGEKTIELWLPQFGQFRLHQLEIADGATLTAHQDERPRWITYGSSITQCRAAPSPTQTWPAIVARTCDLNLTCLGFGGQCHLDAMIARQMRDTPADFLSMCVGINIYGGGTLNLRTFGPSIMGFVQIVREKHPDTTLVLMSPIYGVHREEELNAVGFTLQAMREEVAAAANKLWALGDTNIHLVNGLEILGADSAHLLPDDLHPNGEGYRLMGERFVAQVAQRFFTESP